MGVILGLLVFAGVCLLVANGINSWGASKYGEQEWREFQASLQEDDNKKKYNNYAFSCPMCGSKKVKKISDISRAASVAALGVASSKIGKQWECDNCNHKW